MKKDLNQGSLNLDKGTGRKKKGNVECVLTEQL